MQQLVSFLCTEDCYCLGGINRLVWLSYRPSCPWAFTWRKHQSRWSSLLTHMTSSRGRYIILVGARWCSSPVPQKRWKLGSNKGSSHRFSGRISRSTSPPSIIFTSWLLVAFHVQRLRWVSPLMPGLSTPCFYEASSSRTTTLSCCILAFPNVGARFYRPYQRCLFEGAQVYSHQHWVLHKLNWSHSCEVTIWRVCDTVHQGVHHL